MHVTLDGPPETADSASEKTNTQMASGVSVGKAFRSGASLASGMTRYSGNCAKTYFSRCDFGKPKPRFEIMKI